MSTHCSTATAIIEKVVADIEGNLQMKDPFKTSTSLNRANLAYMVFSEEQTDPFRKNSH